ncbi:hypothetical protein C8R43DRAFT_1119126 [Mycena crocata]|nr:hypothetical protein C8R43DRAFT_1119126 [Mycena crocata]
MKLRITSMILSLFAAGSSLAATLISPKQGQSLSLSHEKFNVTYNSERYFKEESRTISVVISSGASGFPGAEVVRNHSPTSYSGPYGSAVYSLLVYPFFLYGDTAPGNHTVHIVEDYAPYGADNAINILSVPVTFF